MAGILGDVQERDQRSFLCSFSILRPLFLFCSSDDLMFSLSLSLSLSRGRLAPNKGTPFCILLLLYLVWHIYNINLRFIASSVPVFSIQAEFGYRIFSYSLEKRKKRSIEKLSIFYRFLQENKTIILIFSISLEMLVM